MRRLESVYGNVLYRLEEDLFDPDVIDETGFLSLKIENGTLFSEYEGFRQLVIPDHEDWDEEVFKKVQSFAAAGGSVTLVDVDGLSRQARALSDAYPENVVCCQSEAVSQSVPAAKRLLSGNTEKGVRVRKSEYKNRSLLFLHNRTSEKNAPSSKKAHGGFSIQAETNAPSAGAQSRFRRRKPLWRYAKRKSRPVRRIRRCKGFCKKAVAHDCPGRRYEAIKMFAGSLPKSCGTNGRGAEA